MIGNECESSNMSGELPSKEVGVGPSGARSRMPSEPEIGGGPTGARGFSTGIEIHEGAMGEDSTGTGGSIPRSMVASEAEIGGGPTGARGFSTEIEIHEGAMGEDSTGTGGSIPRSMVASEAEIGGGPTGAPGFSTEIEIHEGAMGEDSTGTGGSIRRSMVDPDTPSGSEDSWGEVSDLLEPDSRGQIFWRVGFFSLSFICAVGASVAASRSNDCKILKEIIGASIAVSGSNDCKILKEIIGTGGGSRSYDCKILKEIIGTGGGCASQAISLVFFAIGCWTVLTVGLFTLHKLVTALNELARRTDVGEKRLRSFLNRLFVEAIRVLMGILCLVLSTTYPDKVPKKGGIAMAACLLGSMTCLSLAFMEHDRFGEHAAVGSIFLGVVYICTDENITSMLLGAICCFAGQILLFLWKEFKTWNHVTNREHCAHLLRRLVFILREGGALDTGRTSYIRRLREGLTKPMEKLLNIKGKKMTLEGRSD